MIINVHYEESDTITTQGNYNSIQKYLNNGYYIKENKNGFWVLVKPTRVIVNVNNNTYNMKEQILDFYGKKRISSKLVEKFKNDLFNNKIELIEVNNNCFIQ